jgi:hypothetical protein
MARLSGTLFNFFPCLSCGKPLPERECVAYHGVCEQCWSGAELHASVIVPVPDDSGEWGKPALPPAAPTLPHALRRGAAFAPSLADAGSHAIPAP